MGKKSAEAYLDRLLNSVNGKKNEDGLSEVKEALARLAEEALGEDEEEDDEEITINVTSARIKEYIEEQVSFDENFFSEDN